GPAHADEIGRDAAAETGQVRDDVAPQIRRGRVTVEEDNGITATLIDIGHACTVDLDALQGEREIGGDGLAHDGSFGPPAAGPATRGCACACKIGRSASPATGARAGSKDFRSWRSQGGDEIAPTVDVGVAAVVGGHGLDLR